MKKNILFLLLVVFAILTILFLALFLQRVNLPYNSEGNYFDDENLITYTVQAAEVYGIAAFVGLLCTGLFLYKIMLLKKNHNR